MLDVFLEHAFLDGRWGNPIILNNPPIEEGTIWMSFVQSFLQWSHSFFMQGAKLFAWDYGPEGCALPDLTFHFDPPAVTLNDLFGD